MPARWKPGFGWVDTVSKTIYAPLPTGGGVWVNPKGWAFRNGDPIPAGDFGPDVQRVLQRYATLGGQLFPEVADDMALPDGFQTRIYTAQGKEPLANVGYRGQEPTLDAGPGRIGRRSNTSADAAGDAAWQRAKLEGKSDDRAKAEAELAYMEAARRGGLEEKYLDPGQGPDTPQLRAAAAAAAGGGGGGVGKAGAVATRAPTTEPGKGAWGSDPNRSILRGAITAPATRAAAAVGAPTGTGFTGDRPRDFGQPDPYSAAIVNAASGGGLGGGSSYLQAKGTGEAIRSAGGSANDFIDAIRSAASGVDTSVEDAFRAGWQALADALGVNSQRDEGIPDYSVPMPENNGPY